jgi:hypothetical protein
MSKIRKNKISKVEEPSVVYLSKNLGGFSSMEQQEKYQNIQQKEQLPIERIKETVKLILRIYNTSRTELKNNKNSDRIFFD